MQRRRKPRSEPRNIFDKSSGGKSPKPPSKKTVVSTPTKPTPAKQSLPPTQIKPKAKTTGKQKTTTQPAKKHENEIIPKEDESILEEQLLGVKKRRTRGLSTIEKPESEQELPTTSTKAMEIIEATKARANANAIAEKQQKTAKPTPTKPVKPYRRPKPKFQPANKEQRMDRSRHMEYKYEVRGLLKEIDVAEEYHSSLLGSIWAKGERQTTQDAKQFILDKQNEGILDDSQAEKLNSVVDDYTIRR